MLPVFGNAPAIRLTFCYCPGRNLWGAELVLIQYESRFYPRSSTPGLLGNGSTKVPSDRKIELARHSASSRCHLRRAAAKQIVGSESAQSSRSRPRRKLCDGEHSFSRVASSRADAKTALNEHLLAS
jgi:hypothetical protein